MKLIFGNCRACWYVIGEVMKAHGANVSLYPNILLRSSFRILTQFDTVRQMMSLMSEIAVTVVKIVRATSQVRAPIIRCKRRAEWTGH